MNVFEFRPRFSVNINDSHQIEESLTSAGDASRSQVNRNNNTSDSHGVNVEASGELIYNHRFASKPGRSFSIHARYNFSNTRETGSSIDSTLYYILKDTADLWQESDDHSWSNGYSARVTYTEPVGKRERGMFLLLGCVVKELSVMPINLHIRQMSGEYSLQHPTPRIVTVFVT